MPIFDRHTSLHLHVVLFTVAVLAASATTPTRAADIFQLDRFISELLYADVSYSAQRTQLVDGTPMTTATIAYKNGKERQDVYEEGLGMTVLGITRPDEGVVYVKSTSSKMPALNQETRTLFADLPGATDIEKTDMGEETVNGVAATRYEIAATLDNGATAAGNMWLQGGGVPVKVDLQLELDDLNLAYHIEQTEIQVLAHPDDLFALPAE